MFPFTPSHFLILIAAATFLLGISSIVLGFYILIARSYGREMKVLAIQSARLGQKAITDNIASLTASTAQLVDSVNNLVRTSTGIGVFFVVVGLLLMSAAYYIVSQTDWSEPLALPLSAGFVLGPLKFQTPNLKLQNTGRPL